MLNSQLGELGNHASDEVCQLLQGWDNRLVFPLSELHERYRRGRLQILLDLLCYERGNRARLRACVMRQVGRAVQPNTVFDNCQFPVFIKPVHVVNDAERVIDRVASMVGLQFLDKRQSPQDG